MISAATVDPVDRIAALESAVARGQNHEPLILEALGDPSTLVRERAIALAARHLTPEALGDLLRDDENAILRNAAFAALERQGPYAVPYLLKLTLDGNNEVAMFAVQILSLINDSSAKQALLPLVDHPDRNIAQSAIEALGNVNAVEAVPALIRLLEADLWLQFPAVNALGKLADPRAVEPLLELLGNEMLAEPAVEALGKIGAAEGLEPLLELLFESDRIPLRDQVLRAVGALLDRHPDTVVGTRLRASLAEAGKGSGVVEYLQGLLSADDMDLARAAAVVVVHVQVWELLPEILLRTSAPEETRWVAELLRRHRKATQAPLLQLLKSKDLRVRRGALLCGTFDDKALSSLLARLRDPEADVRAAACRAVGSLRKADAIGALLENLRSDNQQERTAAANALGQMPGRALEVLGPELDPTGEAGHIRTALEILEAARCTSLTKTVTPLLADARPEIRRAALRVMGQYPAAKGEDKIVRALGDSDPSVRSEAVEILVRRRCRKAEPALIALLAAEDPLRYHVIRGLGRLHVQDAAPKLMDLYPVAPAHERIEIVAALNQIAPPTLRTFLKQRLGERDEEVRRVASDGLARLAGAEDIDVLMTLAADGDWVVRNHAAWGLGRLGLPASREALLVLARDVEPIVARTARTALNKIGGEAASAPE